ncbi:MAG TPA: hypothetical protein PKW33_20705 [Anaerolineaceae bacterium]|nr:hypothetical protein [Anaerolineaceae bacterium]HPN54029.1 hypothetical protein [Anaerolineaceae bacterium]
MTLDSALALTRGSPLGLANLVSQLNPVNSTCTGVYDSENGASVSVIGQMRYPLGSRTARLTFLAPADCDDLTAFSTLLEFLAYQAGAWQAYHLVGEVDEHSRVYEALRGAGFSVYAWQRIWRLTANELPSSVPESSPWRAAEDVDGVAIHNLYQMVVPGLMQPMEPLKEGRQDGLVYHEKGELMAYASIIAGPLGIWVQPFVHPSVSAVTNVLLSLVGRLQRKPERPVYICIRSYQAWLESALENVCATCGERQALMARRLVAVQKVSERLRLPVLEKGSPEMPAPMARLKPRT